MRPLLLLPAALLLVACNPIFDVHRRVLGPYRVAGVGVEKRPQDECARTWALIWSGLGPYHDQPLQLSWQLDGEPLGEGLGVPVCGTGLLELTATAPGGTEHLAQVSVAGPPAAWTVSREVVPLAQDLSVTARGALSVEALEVADDDQQMVRVGLDGLLDGYRAQWMSPQGGGHALWLDDSRADLVARTLDLDDSLVESSEPLEGCPDCVRGHAALVLDGEGSNGWGWVEAAYGVEDSLVRHEGWLLRAALPPNTHFAAVTLHTDDSAERGVEFEDFEALDEADDALFDVGCGDADGPFSLDWLVEGRCTRDQVDGQRVVVSLW